MKKLLTTLSVAMFVLFIAVSCGSSPEKDGRQAARYACEFQELYEKQMAGEDVTAEMEELMKKSEEFAIKINEKYGDDEEMLRRYEEALDKELQECL